jgi:hypothetical protein
MRRFLALFTVLPILNGCWVLNSGTCTLEATSYGVNRVDPQALLAGYEAYGPDCTKVSGEFQVQTLSIEDWWVQMQQDMIWFDNGDPQKKNKRGESALRISRTDSAFVAGKLSSVCRGPGDTSALLNFCGTRAGVAVDAEGKLSNSAYKRSNEFELFRSTLPNAIDYSASNTTSGSAPRLNRASALNEFCELPLAQTLGAQVTDCRGTNRSSTRLIPGPNQGLGYVAWSLIYRPRPGRVCGADDENCRVEVWLNENTGQLWWVAGHTIDPTIDPANSGIVQPQANGGEHIHACGNPSFTDDAEREIWEKLKGSMFANSSGIRVAWRLPSRSEVFSALSDGFDRLFDSSTATATRYFWTRDLLSGNLNRSFAFSPSGGQVDLGPATSLPIAVCIGSVDPASW